MTDVDVDTIVSEAISRHKVAADNADIEVRTDAPGNLRVLGDQTLLVTALANLVSNAIAYSPRGSLVSISRRRRGANIEVIGHRPGASASREPGRVSRTVSSGGQGALACHRRQRTRFGHRQTRRG